MSNYICLYLNLGFRVFPFSFSLHTSFLFSSSLPLSSFFLLSPLLCFLLLFRVFFFSLFSPLLFSLSLSRGWVNQGDAGGEVKVQGEALVGRAVLCCSSPVSFSFPQRERDFTPASGVFSCHGASSREIKQAPVECEASLSRL